MVSAPGGGPPATLIVVTLPADWATPVAAQKEFRSPAAAAPSSTMAIVWPRPVQLLETLYAAATLSGVTKD